MEKSKITSVFANLNWDIKLRAQNLTITDWEKLSAALNA